MQPKNHARKRVAAARYFDMKPDELDALLRDPDELREAVAFVLRAVRHLVSKD